MLYVLFVLLAGLGWGLWYILRFKMLFAIIASGVMLLAIIITFIVKRVVASRSANALERALADQGRQQAMNANPQRRGEIEALGRQISDGIKALKQSKLGGKKRGGSALYALPWYAIIGPPGAGKTTALRHSGLVFPYADSAVRGVGGTRNCDWWFTNEAIILDTAGRYATESADQGEWLAFLDMLRKYRGNKPLNGLIVAISIPDIIDANEQHIEATATKLRARIDEVMTRLRMVLPVYLLVTKCDLIAGFVEFFGTMKKSERSQAWGATIDLKEDKQNPTAIFLREYGLLVAEVHSRTVKRLSQERDRQAREAIYQFPLEFLGVGRNLQELVTRVFAPNAFQGAPVFRGFYFTSGTQEGLPMNRVLERMGYAMGIRPMQMGQMPKVESRSYFLHDVFMRVVFPDAEVAGRSASELRRQKIVRVGVSVTALSVALIFCVPSILSYFNNRDLLDDSKVRAEQAAKIDWDDKGNIEEKIERLRPVHDRLRELDKHEANGVPFDYGFLMYQGDSVTQPLVRVFVANMQQGFLRPCKFHLEGRLKSVTGANYYEERTLLRTYLMLSDPEHLEVDWATGVLTNLWASLHDKRKGEGQYDLRQRMEPLVRYYFELIRPSKTRKARAKAVEPNDKIVKHARDVLAKVAPEARYQGMFIESLKYEVYDPIKDLSPGNQQYPPLTLQDVFDGRADVLLRFDSKQHKDTNKWLRVEGPFTDRGHYGALVNFAEADRILRDEQWVIELTSAEKQKGNVAKALATVTKDYEAAYAAAWRAFMNDVLLSPPANLKEAAELYKLLLDPERPYVRLVRTVEDHTQLTRDLDKVESTRAAALDKPWFTTEADRRVRGKELKVDPFKIEGKLSRIPGTFEPLVRFGIAARGKPQGDTALAQWADILQDLRSKILVVLDQTPDAPVDALAAEIKLAVDKTKVLLDPLDAETKANLKPLLFTPLNIGGKFPSDS